MKDSHIMWKIFTLTGSIDAYLYYRDLLQEDEKKDLDSAEVL